MLITLTIKNFVLIDSLEMDFDRGLNIITGETGAGKSIMIDALSILLGERASSDMVRTGEKKAVIEAVFKLKKDNIIFDLLKDNDLDSEDDEIIIRRELLAKGSSRSFLNDSPVKLNLLKTFGNHLVDFHGQHDHQQLLSKDSHINILDIPAKIDKQLAKYQQEFAQLKDMVNELNDLVAREQSMRAKEDIQRFELEEIEKVNPQINEEADLEAELKLLQNSESLFEMSSEVYTQLYSGDDSVHDMLNKVKIQLENLKEIDPEFTEFLSECKSALISADEIAQFAGSYKDNIEFNPQKIEYIRSRLHELSGLRKRYGTYEAIFEKKVQLENDLNLITNFDAEITGLKKRINAQKTIAGKTAGNISKTRYSTAKSFEKNIVNSLETMGIDNSVFNVDFALRLAEDNANNQITVVFNDKEYLADSSGIDQIEFLISTNKGESPKPLAETASGGEISRVMLAVKSIAAESDNLPMLVFDEIDKGISGRIAQKVGLTMKKLAENHQIIAITHLPQIAALGDKNIYVEKHEGAERTTASAVTLDESSKLREIAKMLSGETISESALESAAELTRFRP